MNRVDARDAARRWGPRTAVAALGLAAALAIPTSGAVGQQGAGQDDLPGEAIGTQEGWITMTQTAVARSAKLEIKVGADTPMWGALYLNLYNTPVEDPTSYQSLCARNRPCVPDPFEQPACATDDISTQRRGSYFEGIIYPAYPLKSGGADVGKLADVPVRAVAFGSIPVEATLELRTPRVSGRIQPLKARVWSITQGGCGEATTGDATTVVEGQLDMRLRNLKVDGVSVDVGRTCRIEKPTSINLWGDEGYFVSTGGTLSAREGVSEGSKFPLDSPYYFGDRGRDIPASTGIDIPNFTGCGNGSDDMSRLVSAIASGPNNPVSVSQSGLRSAPFGERLDVDRINLCGAGAGSCALPAPEAPNRPPLPPGDE